MTDLAVLVLLLTAPLVGLVVGMMPAMGVAFTMILFYPVLSGLSPAIILSFYGAVLVSCQFSGSLAAINLGLLGEQTSLPVLKERQSIMRHGLQLLAIRHTAIGSVVATILSMLLLSWLIYQGSSFTWLLRTDFLFALILFTVLLAMFWHANAVWINVIMISSGLFLGTIGLDPATGRDFFTFGSVYLAGGIPQWALLLGLFAVPCMIRIWQMDGCIPMHQKPVTKNAPIDGWSTGRGTVIGFICGMIPAIGLSMSSNIAHMIEKWFRPQDDLSGTLARLNSAESANNAAYVSVLIPMLVLGIAIQPSEAIVLDLMLLHAWTPKNMLEEATIIIMLSSMIYATTISYLSCTYFSRRFCNWFIEYRKQLSLLLVLVMIVNVIYIGWMADQKLYHLLVLSVGSLIGVLFLKYDMMPVLLAFLLQNHLESSMTRLLQMYW